MKIDSSRDGDVDGFFKKMEDLKIPVKNVELIQISK